MKLYTYYRSSAAYRVRIALNLKGLSYEAIPVHLVKNGGEQRGEAYLQKNPQGLVPLLEDDAVLINQSLAIIEYLEEKHPQPALLPSDANLRAQTRSLAHMIAMDIHPLNNLRVLQYLSAELKISDEQKSAWYRHWVEQGFAAIETRLSGKTAFCVGAQPTMADVCLVPQVYNAARFNVDLKRYPEILRINQNCLSLPAFADAAPELQADAE